MIIIVNLDYRQTILSSNDTLWDGQQCNGNEGPCCTNPRMPWFIKPLNENNSEGFELRMCSIMKSQVMKILH